MPPCHVQSAMTVQEKKIKSLPSKVVIVLLLVRWRLLVARWNVWGGGRRLGWRVKVSFLTSVVWARRDTFGELPSSRFLGLCKVILKKHVIYQRCCHSSHRRFLCLEILCSAFLSGRIYPQLKMIRFSSTESLFKWLAQLFGWIAYLSNRSRAAY